MGLVRLRWLRRLMSSRVADWLVRIAVIASVFVAGFSARQSQISQERLEQLTACVAEYNNVNNVRTKVLTAANDQERAAEARADKAQAALFLSPIVSKPTEKRTPAERAEVFRLFRAYQLTLAMQTKERADADVARRDHPIPAPPNEVCD